jgi:hypothetical protein
VPQIDLNIPPNPVSSNATSAQTQQSLLLHHPRILPRTAGVNRVRQLSVAYQIPGIERISGRMMLTGPLLHHVREDENVEEQESDVTVPEEVSGIADPYSPLAALYGQGPTSGM